MTRPADQRRFNVAASRARDQMWLFYSVATNHLSDQCFRRRLIEYFLNPKSQLSHALGENADELEEKAYTANRKIEKAPKPFDSWFEVDVALHIARNRYRVIPQYEFADKRIDLVVEGEKAQLAVECDGDFWHGAYEYASDMERQRKLERCGWHFFRLRESHYYADPDSALNSLWTQLERMGIMPFHMKYDANEEEREENDSDDVDNVDEEQEAFFDQEDSEEDEEENIAREKSYANDYSNSDTPINIQQALGVKSDVICQAIIQVLEERPKYSCVKDKLPTYILKNWNVRSRGKPRDQFAKRVNEQVARMARKGYVVVYKSKNIRVKLGWVTYQAQLF
jgi:very-short-patch-repair endonuclease